MAEVPTDNNARPATFQSRANLRRCHLACSKNEIFEQVSRYLDELAKGDILDKHRLGRENYCINPELVGLLFNLPPLDMDGVP